MNKFGGKFLLSILAFFIFGTVVVSAANFKAFQILNKTSSEILISDGYSSYLVDYSYDCWSFNFSEGDIVYIDTYLSPSFGDTLIVDTLYGDYESCTVSSSEELNLKDYYVEDVIDSNDEIIVQSTLGDRYLVEYGIGCLSMWRYENKYVQIDIGGTFLDGIGDKIYLFNSDDDCKVWDAQNLDGNSSYYNNYYDAILLQELLNNYSSGTSTTASCSENSTLSSDGGCYCNDGYALNSDEDACITNDKWCQEANGVNTYYDTYQKQCTCSEGYFFDDNSNQCEKLSDKNCTEKFGSNSYLNGNLCYCSEGYEFNEAGTKCIEIVPEVVEEVDKTSETDLELIVSPFNDLEIDDPSFEAIYYLYNQGVVNGYDDATFKPDNVVNRAELLKILVEGQVITPDSVTYNNCFDDVKSEWFAPYVCYAKEQGWVSGYADGSFKPDQEVNKVEALKMLLNSYAVEANLDTISVNTLFDDVEYEDWYSPYVYKAKELGILEETGTDYDPAGKMTRAGIAENLYRLLML